MKVNILHLSDIHYGKNHVANDRKQRSTYGGASYNDELEEIKESLEELERNFNVRPNFIVVTGDIAETSSPAEYLLAEEFIGGIADSLDIDRRYVVMIPGNHDVSWDICKEEREKKDNQELNPPFFEKFTNYKLFFDRFYEKGHFPQNTYAYKFSKKLFVNFPFYEKKVIFCGLNSCFDESDQPPHYGNITVPQLKAAIDEINRIDAS